MAFIETRRLTADGVTTSVLIGGAGRAGEAVVFVHGNPGAGSDWMPLMTRVAGFEIGSGFYINPTPPEDAAQYMREIVALT